MPQFQFSVDMSNLTNISYIVGRIHHVRSIYFTRFTRHRFLFSDYLYVLVKLIYL